jgi:high-affinity nickel-transport protein
MNFDTASASGLALMFVLGLRHGFDPDHIAMIDSIAYRSLETRPRMAPWIGTWFALGHGLTVTVIAVIFGAMAGSMANAMPLPAALGALLEWLPIALLILVGTLNLRSLMQPAPYAAIGWKTRCVPQRLRNSSHPLAIFLIGIVFALVFDTATQAAAWGYAATVHSGAVQAGAVQAGADTGIAMALLVGLVFTAGMVITDTLDGRLMVRMLRHLSGRSQAQAYRRKIGWIIVFLSYGIALYAIATHFYPALAMGETMLTLAGCALFAILLGAYLYCVRGFPATSTFPVTNHLPSKE